jgi:hypothetical protein
MSGVDSPPLRRVPVDAESLPSHRWPFECTNATPAKFEEYKRHVVENTE